MISRISCFLLLFIASFLSLSLVGSYQQRLYKSLPFKTSIFVLNPGISEKIATLKADYSSLLKRTEPKDWKKKLDEEEVVETEQKLRIMKSILDGVEALEEIEKDLKLFEVQSKSDDKSIREKAIAFTKEFLVCRDQIEGEINKMLK